MAIEDYREIENMLYGIGPAAFKELSENYYRSEAYIERIEEERIEEKNINTDYCVDYTNDLYMCGEKYVYGWRNQYGELIYIGQGCLERTYTISKSARNGCFNEHANGKLYLYFFAKRVSKITALEIEKMLIQRCCLKGIEIANTKEVLTKWEARYFNKRADGLQVDGNDAVEKQYGDYEEALLRHKDVVAKFDLFLDDIRKQSNAETDIAGKEFVKPDRTRDRRNYWTIDGVSKPATVWCKEYGRSYANVMYRVENFNISLSQALTLPNVQYSKKKGDAMQQWKAMGLL